MIEIRLEIEPQNKTPLDCVNLIVAALENLVKNQDIEHYIVGLSALETEIVPTFKTIHVGGKEW